MKMVMNQSRVASIALESLALVVCSNATVAFIPVISLD